MRVIAAMSRRAKRGAPLPWITTKCTLVTLPATAISEPQSLLCFYRLSQNAAGSKTHHSTLCKVSWPCKFGGYLQFHTQGLFHYLSHTHIPTKKNILYRLCSGLISIWWGLSRKTISILCSLSELQLSLSHIYNVVNSVLYIMTGRLLVMLGVIEFKVLPDVTRIKLQYIFWIHDSCLNMSWYFQYFPEPRYCTVGGC